MSTGYSYMNQTLFTFLPLVILTLFNVLLVRVVIGAARQRQSMTVSTVDMASASAGDQQRITVMLICVVVVFIICQVNHTARRTKGQR